MTEFAPDTKLHIPVAHLQPMRLIGDSALRIAEERYGSGYPAFRPGAEANLTFHGSFHSVDVGQGTLYGGIRLGIAGPALQVGIAAAKSHDIVQLKPRGDMERESAEWFVEEVRRARIYPELAAEMGAYAILGTEPVFEGGTVSQMADRLDYPTKEIEQVSRVVACADLRGIHTGMGPYMSHQLFKEMNNMGPDDTPQDMEKVLGYQRGNVAFVENYKYPHPQGEKIFGGLRGEVAAFHAQLADDIERGAINNWNGVIARDLTFMRKHPLSFAV